MVQFLVLAYHALLGFVDQCLLSHNLSLLEFLALSPAPFHRPPTQESSLALPASLMLKPFFFLFLTHELGKVIGDRRDHKVDGFWSQELEVLLSGLLDVKTILSLGLIDSFDGLNVNCVTNMEHLHSILSFLFDLQDDIFSLGRSSNIDFCDYEFFVMEMVFILVFVFFLVHKGLSHVTLLVSHIFEGFIDNDHKETVVD